MWHFQAKRLLSAYLDQALASEASAQVRGHLERCAKCRQALEEIDKGSRLAKLARRDFGIMDDRALARMFNSLARRAPLQPRLRNLGWSLGLTVAVLLAALGLWWHLHGSFNGKGTEPAVGQSGSLPIDLVLQEATTSENRARTENGPYVLIVTSATELTRRTGEALSEPDLPPEFSFRRGFAYRREYGGGIGSVYAAADGRIVCLFQQPASAKVMYGEHQPKRARFCGRVCKEIRWPSLRLLSWESGSQRTLVVSNLSADQLEVAFSHYPGLH